ncbi:ABC transporter permease [Streptomyces sp. NPDC002845]
MGFRFAFSGGREGWMRAVLTAVGVGLGVALLLLTTAIPSALATRDVRDDNRRDLGLLYNEESTRTEPSDRTVVVGQANTSFRSEDIRGRLLEPEGLGSTPPPGVGKFPARGEMVVSPALKELLASGEGELLRERLPYRVVGTIGEPGLIGSAELAYYAGAAGLAEKIDGYNVGRIERFGVTEEQPAEAMDPVLVLLILVVFVVLLIPVGVFIAAAVRFGGERRDRRLAALRLVGSDSRMTRRIAAGEAVAGAGLGLVFGTGFFLIGRQAAGSVEVFGVSVFPSYLNPSPGLAALVAIAVPAAAVLVTLFALRGVVIEPLGVVRTARPARRRLWWRLLLPLAGLVMLYPMIGQGNDGGEFNQYLVTGGVLFLLVGVTALLPWIVEATVARLGSGAVSWQLAVRRLQLSSGTAARMVNGIAVAVAGAIALQMLFAGVQGDYTEMTGRDPLRAQMAIDFPEHVQATSLRKEFEKTEGVQRAVALSEGWLGDKRLEPGNESDLTVGDCASLREVAELPSCRDGDVFVRSDEGMDTSGLVKPGSTLYIDPSYADDEPGAEVPWTVPAQVTKVSGREDSLDRVAGVLFTPGALPEQAGPTLSSSFYVQVDESVPDVRERVRNTAAAIDPFTTAWDWAASEQSDAYESIRTGLFVGAACVLFLIGASLLVSQLEQLRERKKLLSALVAFGTRRRTLGLSVLWQAAIPIALGLVLASAVGLTLGSVLLKMSGVPVTVDWASVLSMTGVGAGIVALVTALSLPPLLRLIRPDGLRTE